VIAAVATYRPGVALSALFCNFALEQWGQSQVEFFSDHPALTNYLTAGVVAWAVLMQLVRFGAWWVLRQYSTVGWLTLALLGYAAVSTLWSLVDDAKEGYINALPYIITYTLLCPLVVTRAKDLHDGFVATLILGSLLLVLLLTTSTWGYRQVIIYSLVRGGTAGGNPLAIGSMAGYVILLAALMNTRRLKTLWNLIRWPLVLLGMVLCVLSQSRGQVFGALIAFVCALPISRRLKGSQGIAGVMVGLVVMSLFTFWTISEFAIAERWEYGAMRDSVEGGRVNKTFEVLEYWGNSGPMRWIFGLGNSASFSTDVIGFYPHNLPGEVLGEEGIVGFSIYVAILVALVRALRRLWFAVAPYDDARGLFAVLCALLIYEFILSNKQGSLLGNQEFFGLTIIAGQLSVAVQRHVMSTRPAAGRALHPLTT